MLADIWCTPFDLDRFERGWGNLWMALLSHRPELRDEANRLKDDRVEIHHHWNAPPGYPEGKDWDLWGVLFCWKTLPASDEDMKGRL